MVSGDSARPPDRGWLEGAIRSAVERRELLVSSGADHVRLVFGDAEGAPGIVADLYGEVCVVYLSGAFMLDNIETVQQVLIESVSECYGWTPRCIVRGDEELLALEGVDPRAVNLARPELDPSPASGRLVVRENGLSWYVAPGSGQKTGLFCDQCDNRGRVARLAAGARVLDAFCYHGGFGLTALAAGARHLTAVDSSRDALDALAANARLQGVDPARITVVRGNAFELLRRNELPQSITEFDVIVLDPPKLVARRDALEAGLRAYKDLNLSVIRHAAPGARIATFSCSGGVTREQFRRALAWAAGDARRTVRIEEVLGQPGDHPVPLAFPEAEYLTGFLLRVQ